MGGNSLGQLLLVGVGGFAGSIARFLVSTWASRWSEGPFPWGTFGVNLAGCLLIGLLAGALEGRDLLAMEARLLLMAGLLGGFTTFSAFGLETFNLLRAARPLLATAYAGGSLLLGLAAVWAGHTGGRML